MAVDELLSLRQQLFPPVPESEAPAEPDAQRLPTVAGRISQLADSVVTFFKVFGWADVDWQSEKGSDVAWACGDARWLEVRDEAALRLAAWLRLQIAAQKPLWKAAPNFAGLARFLPAYPVNVNLAEPNMPTPRDPGELQLDVLAAHHREYDQGTPGYEDAPDTEDPNLVFFPTVTAGHVFAFTVLGRDTQLVERGRRWLERGLEVFGLGAKTGAGYGWFLDVSTTVVPLLEQEERTRPWLSRAEGFTALDELEKELLVLQLAAESELVAELEKQARNKTRALRDFYQHRSAGLDQATLAILNQARVFLAADDPSRDDAGLELSDHVEALQGLESSFPNLLAPALAWLRQNGFLLS